MTWSMSLGGLVALRVAARRPDLVRGLVMVEAAPADGDPELADQAAISAEKSLREWPTPFSDLQEAGEFFTARFQSQYAGFTWATGLEARPDGLWPCFDPAVVTDLLRDALKQPGWADWRAVRCPVLIVRGERGTLSADTVHRMAEALPAAQTATLPAGHDVHLDAPPEQWGRVLTNFLDSLPDPPRS